MTDIDTLSEELADEHDVNESEMWGFVASADAMGHREETIRRQAGRAYGDTE